MAAAASALGRVALRYCTTGFNHHDNRGIVLPDHYATLGVAPSARPAVIRGAYLQLMRRYHPDRNSSAAGEERARAITLAYSVLCVADRRAAYDAQRTRSLAAERLANMPQRQQWQLGPLLRMFFGIGLFMLLLPLLLSPAALQPERPGAQSTAAVAQEAVALEQDQNGTSWNAESVEMAAKGAEMVSLSRLNAIATPVADALPLPGGEADAADGVAAPQRETRRRGHAKLAQQISTYAMPPSARPAHMQKNERVAERARPRPAASTQPARAAAQAVQAPPPQQAPKPAWQRPLPPVQPPWLRPLPTAQPAWQRPLPPLKPEIATAGARASDGQ